MFDAYGVIDDVAQELYSEETLQPFFDRILELMTESSPEQISTQQ